MSSPISKELIRFFEKLPSLPLCQISKHLNACAIAVVAEYSKKWEEIVKKRRNKTSVWEIRITKDQIGFWIGFTDKAQSFFLSSKEQLVNSANTPFSKELQLHSLNCLKILSKFFPPTRYGNIFVSLGPRCPKFSFRFLSRLPRGTATYMHLEGDLEVNGAELVKFLENVQVKDQWSHINRLDVQVRIKNLVTSDQIRFENNYLDIRDARFLTRESTPKFGTYLAEIGVNNFTSQDLNAFLKSWMVARKNAVTTRSYYTIGIREDQNIKLEEVMEGLYPYNGNQRFRDRWHIHPIKHDDLLNIKVTDMNGGLDIESNWPATLGTVLLEPNRFTFVSWMHEFNWNSYEKDIRALIKKYGDSVSRERKVLERLEKQNARRRHNPNAELQSRIRECRQKVEQEESNMAKSCEIYNKLITEWKNN